jgi:class 3 adenylate cyclase
MPYQNATYMVLRDLRATHVRRARVMVMVSSAFLILLGGAYAGYFFARGEPLAAAVQLSMLVIGAWAILVTLKDNLRFAIFLLLSSLFLVFVGIALFVDVPSAQVPRSAHHGLLPLGVAGYLLLRTESIVWRHGYPVACMLALAWLSSSNISFSGAFASQFVMPENARALAIWGNNFSAFGMLYVLVHIFVGDINQMEGYLLNANNRFVKMVSGMFSKTIAERLLAKGETFAERHADCSILFADIVGFTSLSERISPVALVDMLTEIFARFDRVVEQKGLTKIKTIGDAYMVASGVPEARADHAKVLVEFGQEMLALIRDIEGIDLRIGIASGELVAGVIGQSRQLFDVWGDVVNTASRMESHGVPGRIQVSESTYQLTREAFSFEPREQIPIKGKDGKHNVYLLKGGARGG